jgi:serine/threonine-protein kinase
MDTKKLFKERYEIIDLLGRGGMAEVFLADDTILKRKVAIKIIKAQYAKDEIFREQFLQEARSAGGLSHQNIVTVHDVGFINNRIYMIMEYVPGTDLYTYQHQKDGFSIREAVNFIIQACSGIGYAHRKGIIHCDVKPQNLIVTEDGTLKVTDFGIARFLSNVNPIDEEKVVWGSPQYFSPEQAKGKITSYAADVYSLGVVLYQAVTGKLPFTGDTSKVLMEKHINKTPPSPRSINSKIPVELEGIILRSLSKEPSSRYRNANQMGKLLENLYPNKTPILTLSSENWFKTAWAKVKAGWAAFLKFRDKHIFQVDKDIFLWIIFGAALLAGFLPLIINSLGIN